MNEHLIRKEIDVDAPAERVFRIFTERFDLWWPPSHHIGQSALESITLEPREGGRWYERCADGTECQWGKVLAWQPPKRVLLAWQLDMQWQYDPALLTEVDVRFEALGPKATRVVLEHRNLDRFGESEAARAARAAMGGEQGWTGMLALLRAACVAQL